MITGYCAQVAEPNQTKNVCAYILLKFDMSIVTIVVSRTRNESKVLMRCNGATLLAVTDMMLYVEAESMESLNRVRDQLQSYPDLRHLNDSYCVD